MTVELQAGQSWDPWVKVRANVFLPSQTKQLGL